MIVFNGFYGMMDEFALLLSYKKNNSNTFFYPYILCNHKRNLSQHLKRFLFSLTTNLIYTPCVARESHIEFWLEKKRVNILHSE